MKFYKCAVCGKIISLQDGSDSIPTICCGQEMKEYLPNTTEGAGEKHLPTYSFKDKDTLVTSVGAVVHPSMENHYIKWIMLETDKGNYFRNLKWNDVPVIEFPLIKGEKPLSIYTLCNIHGLWKAEVGPGKKRCCFLTLCP